MVYFKEKMKVKLAAQTFSNSVANALEFCSESLNLIEFKGCKPTIIFCKQMNNIFDLLNTRNYLSKDQYKNPISYKNENNIIGIIHKSIKYLTCIQCETKIKVPKTSMAPVINSSRKTGFLGLIICLKSVKNIIYDVLRTKQMDFLLTYKLSQDHLEMFFLLFIPRAYLITILHQPNLRLLIKN